MLPLLAKIAVTLIALLHVYIMVLEMFLWTTPRGRRAFGNSVEKAETTEHTDHEHRQDARRTCVVTPQCARRLHDEDGDDDHDAAGGRHQRAAHVLALQRRHRHCRRPQPPHDRSGDQPGFRKCTDSRPSTNTCASSLYA